MSNYSQRTCIVSSIKNLNLSIMTVYLGLPVSWSGGELHGVLVPQDPQQGGDPREDQADQVLGWQ